MEQRLRPLDELTAAEARGVRGIFCDIDDTLTHGGRLVPEAYTALCNAAKAGLRVVPVTGRPCGWAEVLASLWPVDAVIGEGGAGAALPNGEWLWWDDEATRAAQRTRLAALLADVRARLPDVRLAGDSELRRVDMAFDINERVHLDGPTREALLDVMRLTGAPQVSTVHAHAVLADYDKARMAVRVAASLWQESAADVGASYLFVGDSPNDQAGFAFFPLSVGVANVRRYAAALPRRRATSRPARVATASLSWWRRCWGCGSGSELGDPPLRQHHQRRQQQLERRHGDEEGCGQRRPAPWRRGAPRHRRRT